MAEDLAASVTRATDETDADLADPYLGLFEDVEGHSVIVQLRRTSPQTDLAGNPTTGYLEDLPPGLPSYEGYISRRWGGGVYLLSRKVDGRYDRQRTMKIVGPPISNTATKEFGLSGPVQGQPGGHVLDGASFEGISLDGNDDQFVRTFQRLALVRHLLQPPESVNNKLLEVLLNRQAADPIQQVSSILSVVEMLKDQTAGGEPATDWFGLIGKALEALKSMGANQANSGRMAGAAEIPARVTAGALPALPPVRPGNEPNEPNESEKGVQRVNPTQQVAAVAIANITAGFRLDPPLTPEEVVSVLDQIIPHEDAILAKIESNKRVLRSMADLQLEEHYADHEGARAAFADYFEVVLTRFCDRNREPNTL
jgi:hypothetical protein